MEGYGTYNMPPGTWSDDSSMALATLDSIREKGDVIMLILWNGLYDGLFMESTLRQERLFIRGIPAWKQSVIM